MPLKEHPTIGLKLQAIETPVIEEFCVPGEDLATFQQLSQVVISRYHQTVRVDAYSYEAKARIHQTILPDEVLDLTPTTEFVTAE
ncbi:MAG: hypothetical protein IV107_17790 [Paucibacter sp.]|nr:hypothetical protein [Roseateles sp.]